MSNLLRSLLVLGVLLVSLSALAAREDTGIRDGLWVTLDVGGNRYQQLVTHPEAVRYVRKFAAGQASSVVPARLLDCPANARVVSARECRDGRCVKLRGLYAGRSPAI